MEGLAGTEEGVIFSKFTMDQLAGAWLSFIIGFNPFLMNSPSLFGGIGASDDLVDG